jgi:signal transduction histidine kinase
MLARTEVRDAPMVRMDALAVARERVGTWQPVAQELNVRLTVRGPAALVSCAPDVLDQVLDVLLDNALHIAPAGSTVQVQTVVRGSRLALHVADEGRGMTAAEKAQACDRFWRGSGQKDREGSGLGLAIARTLMASVGGSLNFDDAAPSGLVVVLGLRPWSDYDIGANGRAGDRGQQRRLPGVATRSRKISGS